MRGVVGLARSGRNRAPDRAGEAGDRLVVGVDRGGLVEAFRVPLLELLEQLSGVPAAGGVPLYRVTARVQWRGANGNRLLELETLIAERK